MIVGAVWISNLIVGAVCPRKPTISTVASPGYCGPNPCLCPARPSSSSRTVHDNCLVAVRDSSRSLTVLCENILPRSPLYVILLCWLISLASPELAAN